MDDSSVLNKILQLICVIIVNDFSKVTHLRTHLL